VYYGVVFEVKQEIPAACEKGSQMNCQTYHYDTARLGFGDGAPQPLRWYKHLEINFGAATRGAPLVYSQRILSQRGIHFRTYVYIASSDNAVRAYDEANLVAGDSTPLWITWLGTPASGANSNIGGVVGVTSTPVLDPNHSKLFVCSRRLFWPIRISRPPLPPKTAYFMHALNMYDGTILQSAELTDIADADRDVRFNALTQDQRGALNLVDGTVYATFAAFSGNDLGDYHGWLVGCDANDLTNQHYLPTTKTVLGGGCWGPGGAAAAADGSLYIATGNAMWAVPQPDLHDTALKQKRKDYFDTVAGEPPARLGDYFLSVLRIRKITPSTGVPPRPSGTPRLEVVDWFQPAQVNRPADYAVDPPNPIMTLQELDENDLDFGSSSCLLLPDIDQWHLAVVSTKGFVFLLDRDNLGRSGPALDTIHVFTGYDASQPSPDYSPAESHSAPAYLHANGEHLVFFSGGGVSSQGTVKALVCYKVGIIDGHPALSLKWSADVALTNACASPTVGVSNTNIFGQPDFHALVWVADLSANDFHGGGAFIQAHDALTGCLVFDSLARENDQLSSDLPHYAPITCAGQSVYLGTANGFAMFRAGSLVSRTVRVAF
jgi:hypothetical protein